MKSILTKPIILALVNYSGAPDLYWRFSGASEFRTAPYGYALYCCTGTRENGTSIERRLWCGDIERARRIAAELSGRGMAGMPNALEKLHGEIEAEDDRRERQRTRPIFWR